MVIQSVALTNNVGLNYRPVTCFVQVANNYRSDIWLEFNKKRVNAKDMLAIISLGIHTGDEITLIANGVDEQELIVALVRLVESDFSDMPKLEYRE